MAQWGGVEALIPAEGPMGRPRQAGVGKNPAIFIPNPGINRLKRLCNKKCIKNECFY
jgi:hypothetical protein